MLRRFALYLTIEMKPTLSSNTILGVRQVADFCGRTKTRLCREVDNGTAQAREPSRARAREEGWPSGLGQGDRHSNKRALLPHLHDALVHQLEPSCPPCTAECQVMEEN